MSFGMTASVRLEPHAPISTGTLSLVISFSATAAASVGLLLLSSMTSSSFLPRMPPFCVDLIGRNLGAVDDVGAGRGERTSKGFIDANLDGLSLGGTTQQGDRQRYRRN